MVVQLSIKVKSNTEWSEDTEPLHGKDLQAI